jgi:putative transposase
VRLVIADAHLGLAQAVRTVLLGAGVQRCRVHFMRNVLAVVPKANSEMVAALIRTIFAQPDAAAVREQHIAVAAMLGRQFPKVQAMLETAAEELLAFTAFPTTHWKKIWSTDEIVNPLIPAVVSSLPRSMFFGVRRGSVRSPARSRGQGGAPAAQRGRP